MPVFGATGAYAVAAMCLGAPGVVNQVLRLAKADDAGAGEAAAALTTTMTAIHTASRRTCVCGCMRTPRSEETSAGGGWST